MYVSMYVHCVYVSVCMLVCVCGGKYVCWYVCVAVSMCDGVYLDVGIAVHYRLDDIVEDIWYSVVFRLAV